MENEDLLARKKAFAEEVRKRKKLEVEYLLYPEDSNIKIDVKTLNKELGLASESVFQVTRLGDMFMVPKGMDEKFIHLTLVPERIEDDEVKMVQ
jgi:hypothetical protein